MTIELISYDSKKELMVVIFDLCNRWGLTPRDLILRDYRGDISWNILKDRKISK